MKYLFLYLKYIGLFFLFIIGIAIFTSLINLTNINSSFISKMGIILTALSFFLVVSLASKKINEKGYLLGLKLGLIFTILLILTNLILFRSSITLSRFIYYLILIASGVLGGSFGKNLPSFKKKNSFKKISK